MIKFRKADIKDIISTVRRRSPQIEFESEKLEEVTVRLVEVEMHHAITNALADMLSETMIPIFQKIIGDELKPPSDPVMPASPRQAGSIGITMNYPPITPYINLSIHNYPEEKPKKKGQYLVYSENHQRWYTRTWDGKSFKVQTTKWAELPK